MLISIFIILAILVFLEWYLSFGPSVRRIKGVDIGGYDMSELFIND